MSAQAKSTAHKKKSKLSDFISLFTIKDGRMDVLFLLLVFVILVIGVMMMFSASYAYSYAENNGDSFSYFRRQVIFAIIGLAMMYIVSKIEYRYYEKFAVLLMAIALILLILVLINPAEVEGKESHKRWLKIGFTFQPSEIAKIALIIFLSWAIIKFREQISAHPVISIIPFMIVVGAVCVLIVFENHLSATILMFAIGTAMTFLGGTSPKPFILIIGVCAVVGFIVIANRESLVERGILPDYINERLEGWLNKDFEPQGARWQTNQSLYAIGSGGLFGAGIGNSKQKYLYLPEPQNDFVFSVVCEELGFIRTLGIVILFILLILRGLAIARHSKDAFGTLLVTGIMFQVGLQTALNIGVVTDVLPNTGISLPFFSYGGTSLVILLIEMGMVLAVSRRSNIKKLL